MPKREREKERKGGKEQRTKRRKDVKTKGGKEERTIRDGEKKKGEWRERE